MPVSEPVRPFAFRQLRGVRVTASPAAIDVVPWPPEAVVIRIAPDDAFVVDATLDDAAPIATADPHGIVENETLFHGAWLDQQQLATIVDRLEWAIPERKPGATPVLAQGMAAGLSIKLWLESDRSLLIVSASVIHEVPGRLGPVA